MTQASLSTDPATSVQGTRPDDLVAVMGLRRAAATLWFFGLTAMTLVFAALLLLGTSGRIEAIDGSVRTVLTGYTLLVLGIGLAGFAFVLASGRRNGLLGSADQAGDDPGTSILPVGLVVAPTVPSSSQLPPVRRSARERRPRTPRQAMLATGGPPRWPQVEPAFLVAPTRVARRPAARRVAQVGPHPRSRAIPSSTALPGSRTRRPGRTAGVPSAHIRPGLPPVRPGVRAVALQTRLADLRSPAWRGGGVDRPTLTDRLLGRGTHQVFLPSSPSAPAVPPRPSHRSAQLVRHS